MRGVDAEERALFRVGWLFDGSGAPPRGDVLLTVQRGVVVSIAPFPRGDEKIPGLVDWSGCTLLPPLVDSHVHLAMSASLDLQVRNRQLDQGYDEVRPVIAAHLGDHFRYGVLAVRDGGDRRDEVRRCLTETVTGKNLVQVRTPGQAWHRKGRYGAFIGRSVKTGDTLGRAFSRLEDYNDHCKVINSGLNSLQEFGKQTRPQFSRQELRDFVQLAHGQGRRVMVHANGEQPVRDAVLAGCDSIEHGYFMGRDNLELMAEKQVTWVPTAVVMQSFVRIAARGGEGMNADVVERTLEDQLTQMSLGRRLGVPMAVGTDAGCMGVFHGRAMAEELQLFVQAGFSLARALHCATAVGARLLDLEHTLGLLAPGRPSSFLVVAGGPATLLDRLGFIRAIVVAGQVCAGDLPVRQ
jgi:imidazolonepropionase-like amidohydrolase